MTMFFQTNVGSHMWNMNHKDSDIDIFEVYIEPVYNVLIGKKSQSHRRTSGKEDIATHEIGKVVDMVLKNNINFIWGVTSPIEIDINPQYKEAFDELSYLTIRNLSKQIYHSAHGLATHNYKKYVVTEKDTSEKRCNIIIRSLEFAISVLRTGEIRYRPVNGGNADMILEKIKQLDSVYKVSSLPEKPQHEMELCNWLYDLRLKEIEEMSI